MFRILLELYILWLSRYVTYLYHKFEELFSTLTSRFVLLFIRHTSWHR
jgi:hypothetical protein